MLSKMVKKMLLAMMVGALTVHDEVYILTTVCEDSPVTSRFTKPFEMCRDVVSIMSQTLLSASAQQKSLQMYT